MGNTKKRQVSLGNKGCTRRRVVEGKPLLSHGSAETFAARGLCRTCRHTGLLRHNSPQGLRPRPVTHTASPVLPLSTRVPAGAFSTIVASQLHQQSKLRVSCMWLEVKVTFPLQKKWCRISDWHSSSGPLLSGINSVTIR